MVSQKQHNKMKKIKTQKGCENLLAHYTKPLIQKDIVRDIYVRCLERNIKLRNS